MGPAARPGRPAGSRRLSPDRGGARGPGGSDEQDRQEDQQAEGGTGDGEVHVASRHVGTAAGLLEGRAGPAIEHLAQMLYPGLLSGHLAYPLVRYRAHSIVRYGVRHIAAGLRSWEMVTLAV